ncbi:MAG: Rab family GTPase [Promethearchaeota archaeon]|jgi:small GTP-binding protein
MKKTIKVIVSGDGGVGKTSFLNRLINNSFDANSSLTKGVDFFSKDVHVNGFEYNFILWDFAGQRQFKKLLSDFLNGSLAAFVLFDLSRFTTLEGVEEWMKKLERYGEIPTIILGSKRDVVDLYEMTVFDDYISEIRRNHKNIIGYLKISSKTGFNIEEAFYKLIEEISN